MKREEFNHKDTKAQRRFDKSSQSQTQTAFIFLSKDFAYLPLRLWGEKFSVISS
jgi:hypothetical protein